MKPLKQKWAALALVGVVVLLGTSGGRAQESREALITSVQEEKSKKLQPEEQDRIELFIKKMVEGGWFFSPTPRGLYPYFDSVYSGGGLTLGAGYRKYVGDYSFAELRGLYSFKNYKRFEFRVVTPYHAAGRLGFDATAGWMDATQIGYYGLGPKSHKDSETNFRIQEAYYRGGVTVKPVPWFHLRAASGYENIVELDGTGQSPTVGDKFNSKTAPGLGVSPAYIHSEASAALVWAPAEGYARRGGDIRYTYHFYANTSGKLDDFQLSREEVVQHIPFLRETWVLSLRGRLESVHGSGTVPYYLLPWIGNGSTLRGYSTGRFRDRDSMLYSAEWRWFPNRFGMDMALFSDAGTVAPRFKDLKFSQLKYDYGIGIRFHGPAMTALRLDVAYGSEGLRFVFSNSAAF
jgi:hypothetical protein